MCDLARQTPLDGLFAEVGVYRGGTAFFLNQLRIEQGRPPMHLFDTFTGIPEKSPIDGHRIGDFGKTSLAEVQAVIPDAIYHVGIFPATLPIDLTGFAFIHIDCDQYRSIRACCRWLVPRLIQGGIVYFDDYGMLRGATAAVDECLPERVIHPNGKAYYTKP